MGRATSGLETRRASDLDSDSVTPSDDAGSANPFEGRLGIGFARFGILELWGIDSIDAGTRRFLKLGQNQGLIRPL